LLSTRNVEDHETLSGITLMDVDQAREFRLAGAAPGREEVDQNRLALEVGKAVRPPIATEQLKSRGSPVAARRRHLGPRRVGCRGLGRAREVGVGAGRRLRSGEGDLEGLVRVARESVDRDIAEWPALLATDFDLPTGSLDQVFALLAGKDDTERPIRLSPQ